MFQTKVVEKIKTHVLCSITFFFFENLAVCVIMWTNIVEPDRPQMTIRRMRIACWIPKAINTLRICNTYYFSTATMVARTLLNVTFYLRCLSCLSVMSACGSRGSSLVQCLGFDMNNLCTRIGVCVWTTTRYYYILQNL